MIEAAPGQLYTAVVEDAPTGAPMGVKVEDGSGNVVTPHTTADIVEIAPGVYSIDSLVAPSNGGDYIVIWDNGNVPLTPDDITTETLRVAYVGTVGAPPPGLEPFREFGQVQDREGNILVEVAVSIWRDTSSTSASEGEQYDYLATCSINGADALVEKSNRLLIVGATTYRVLDATRYDVLPHLELSLRRVLP